MTPTNGRDPNATVTIEDRLKVRALILEQMLASRMPEMDSSLWIDLRGKWGASMPGAHEADAPPIHLVREGTKRLLEHGWLQPWLPNDFPGFSELSEGLCQAIEQGAFTEAADINRPASDARFWTTLALYGPLRIKDGGAA